jgi:hypothetical protein
MRVVLRIALSGLALAPMSAAQIAPPLQARAASRTSVQLAWSDPFANETGFELQRAVGSASFAPLALLPADLTTWVDATVAADTTYRYRLRARFAGGVSGWSIEASATTPANRLPTITCNVPQDVEFRLDAATLTKRDAFVVTVADPDGDRVSLSLLNPPPGAVFVPVIDAPSPATLRVRFDESRVHDLPYHLRFDAHDSFDPTARARFVERMTFLETHGVSSSNQSCAALVEDVTGDGIDDLVAVAPLADVGAVVNAGAIYVWQGPLSASGQPTATLTVPSSFGAAAIGYMSPQSLYVEDLTGDGVPDVLACSSTADVNTVHSSGAVFLWAGGAALAGNVAPSATLVAPIPGISDQLGSDTGLVFVDFDGDGVLDLFTGSPYMDHGGLSLVGGLLYWRGGPALVGTVAATAALYGSAKDDQLLLQGHRSGAFGDVTGDGRLDVVAAAPLADVAGAVDAGAILVWDGTGLSGVPAPTATLSVPGGAGYMLGRNIIGSIDGQVPRLADVDGDGVLDVISVSLYAQFAGKVDAGGAFVWSGGAGLVGSVAPTASLHRTPEVAYDYMGSTLDFSDVTGDGVLDILVGSSQMSYAGYFDSGGLLLFEGGPGLVGAPKQRAQLVNSAGGIGWFARMIATVDLDEDGVLDVVSTSETASVGGVKGVGAIWVWLGGAGLIGVTDPHATLTHGGVADDAMSGIAQFHDLDGDGHLDVLGMAPWADVGGVADRGAFYLFSGYASGWRGAIGAKATLTDPNGVTSGTYGVDVNRARRRQLADVDGDGIVDLIVASPLTRANANQSGALHVYKGGAGLVGTVAPTAQLQASSAATSDSLGSGGTGWVFQSIDVDGDAILDVVASCGLADIGGVKDVGALYVWHGGAGLAGNVNETARLAFSSARKFDKLAWGEASQGWFVVDLDDDAVLDLLALDPLSDFGKADSGVIQWWRGPFQPGDPTATYSILMARAFDMLGS